jgi:hypothetical protein
MERPLGELRLCAVLIDGTLRLALRTRVVEKPRPSILSERTARRLERIGKANQRNGLDVQTGVI